MQLKINNTNNRKKINKFIPLQVMWEHMNVRTADIQADINIFKYIIACLNHKGSKLPRPQCEINFLQKVILNLSKQNGNFEEIAICRALYADLLAASCISAKSTTDSRNDYCFMIEEASNSKNKYYHPDYYLSNLTRLIHHIVEKNNKDKILHELMSAFRQACVHGTYPSIKKLLENIKQIENWDMLDNKTQIFQLLLNNQILKRTDGVILEIVRLNNKQIYQLFKTCLIHFGKEVIVPLLHLLCWREGKHFALSGSQLSNSYCVFSYAVLDVFQNKNSKIFKKLWPDKQKRGCVKEYFAAFNERIKLIKQGNAKLQLLLNPDCLLRFNFDTLVLNNYEYFYEHQQDWLVNEYLLSRDGINNLIYYFHARDRTNKFELRAKEQFIKFVTANKLDDTSCNVLENMDYYCKILMLILFFPNETRSFSVTSFCALIKGLSVLSEDLIVCAKKFNLTDENLLAILPNETAPVLELDAFDEEKRSDILDAIFYQGAMIALAFARNQFYCDEQNMLEKSNSTFELSKIPFALAVAILNNNAISSELETFNSRFDEINNRSPVRYQICRSEFMTLNTVKLVNLYELLGNYLFTFLNAKLIISLLDMCRFFDNYDFISNDYASIIHQLKKCIIQKNDNLTFSNILLSISLYDSLRTELHIKGIIIQLPSVLEHWAQFLEQTTKGIADFIPFLTNKIFELYCHILNISVDTVNNFVDKEKIKLLLLGRKRIKTDCYMGFLDKLLAEDIKIDGSFNHLVSNINQYDFSGRRLAYFNQAIKKKLEAKNIHSELVINYPIKHQFTVKMDERGEQFDLCASIWQELLNIEQSLTLINKATCPNSINSIIRSLNILKKEVTKGSDDKAKVIRLLNKPLQVHFDKIGRAFTQLNKSAAMPQEFLDFFREFIEKTQRLVKQSEVHFASSQINTEKKFTIKQMNKSDMDTLILGEYLSCCLAPGSNQFSAIIQRRIDASMMMHVVIDEAIGQPVCGNWLFLAYNKHKPADVYLIANFYEIRVGYGMKPHLRDQMILELTEFSAQYARTIGAKGFLIRPLTYGLIPDFDKLPVLSDSCFKLNIAIEKIGGYFDPREKLCREENKKKVKDLYYLNAVRLTQFYQYGNKDLILENKDKIESNSPNHFFYKNKIKTSNTEFLYKKTTSLAPP